MKPLKDMTTDELVSYVAGRLIISIGRGDFRSEVALWVLSLQQLGSDNAKKNVKKR
jgi:hypothetical protein